MFVCVARLTLEIPASGSLKAKRQILRRVTDRVKARFNVSVAEVDDNELWQRATIALAVVSNERRHAAEQMEKMIQFVDDLYVAPLIGRETEVLAFGDERFGGGAADDAGPMRIPSGQRSLAEAEGLGEWEKRHEGRPPPTAKEPRDRRAGDQKKLSLADARAKAASLRNRREWEKE
jgi:uncharacterized protein YlxP (DUF503 family)